MENTILISNVSDASFAISVAHNYEQQVEISDIVSLKTFANQEFCSRFLLEGVTEETLGYGLKGKSVCIVSTASPHYTRNELAMRNFILARAAKENGAEYVALIEPDLFYSAQDRGPRTIDHPQVTDFDSRQKFAGQPCSSLLYAQLLKEAGVDLVMTVHNHKPEVMKHIYQNTFQGDNALGKLCFINLDISHIVANYILNSGLARLENHGKYVGFVAPDRGATGFANHVREYTGLHNSVLVTIDKKRHGQREVELNISDDIELLKGRDVFVLDDMVRTGGTISANMNLLAENEKACPENIFFYCTHTYISPEGRENLNSKNLKQFITTNTIPNILNRDDQGRLRKKTVVLKIEKWIANAIVQCLEHGNDPSNYYGLSSVPHAGAWYDVDISSKNPRRYQKRVAQYELEI
ncbi:phosphoribosyltransferase family protein [Deltaproteobacteria bacterium TL4]